MKYPNNTTEKENDSMKTQSQSNPVTNGNTPGDGAQDPSMREAIAALAYGLSEQRGPVGGSPLDDWLQAEQLVREHVHQAA
jgi:hypothetical protein